MTRARILRMAAWGAAIAALAGLVAAILWPSEEERLYRQVSAKGALPLAELTSVDWDRVCVVGPYCSGFVTGPFCDRFDEGTWGLVFFKEEQAVAVKTYSRKAAYEGPVGPASCSAPADKAALIATGTKTLTLGRPSP